MPWPSLTACPFTKKLGVAVVGVANNFTNWLQACRSLEQLTIIIWQHAMENCFIELCITFIVTEHILWDRTSHILPDWRQSTACIMIEQWRVIVLDISTTKRSIHAGSTSKPWLQKSPSPLLNKCKSERLVPTARKSHYLECQEGYIPLPTYLVSWQK